MWGKRIQTKLLVVEEVFGLLSVTFYAVVWHTALDAALARSCWRTTNRLCYEYAIYKKLAQQVRTEHEQSSHVRWAFWQCMQALLAFFFFTTGLVMLTVSGMSARLRLTVVVAVMVVVMAWSG